MLTAPEEEEMKVVILAGFAAVNVGFGVYWLSQNALASTQLAVAAFLTILALKMRE